MRKLTIMMSVLLSVGLFCACSNNDEDDFFDGGLPPSEGYNEEPSISFSPRVKSYLRTGLNGSA